MTDAFRNIKSEMHTCVPEYIFRINAIMVVNERKVGTSCRAKDIPECKLRKDSESLLWVWTVSVNNKPRVDYHAITTKIPFQAKGLSKISHILNDIKGMLTSNASSFIAFV
ncbi:hypothetical protein MTR_8g028745 [Medicago truncatula]|uniref:Uncharacterized protein n=1 Tax=Medicago truncatula TaxID=3880 RepID=A0A072TPQ7_MEDTR|nr:hypothetical protein MTR_8g028745 [Medicago truncatula]